MNFKMPVAMHDKLHADIPRWNMSFVLRFCLQLAGFGDKCLVENMACRLLQVHQLQKKTCSGLLDLPRCACVLVVYIYLDTVCHHESNMCPRR